MQSIEGTGIDKDALQRYIEEQIYTLPGTDRHRGVFTVLLTGSRAVGTHAPTSDVDIDVLCPQSICDSVRRACFEAGIISSVDSFWCSLKGDNWDRYFGEKMGRPHFSLNSLETVERQFAQYEDVPLWIWTNARIITDPGEQFQRVRDRFHGYPKDVLVRKIKYRWLLSGYWAVDGYPGNHAGDDEFLAAASSVLYSFQELLKMCFLVEGRPFPYPEKLMQEAETTDLGKELGPVIRRSVNLAVGKAEPDLDPWERLDRAIEPVRHQDPGTEGERLWNACARAMVAAGVDEKWVEADWENIHELLSGSLGPPP